jgi:hypothetical protein
MKEVLNGFIMETLSQHPSPKTVFNIILETLEVMGHKDVIYGLTRTLEKEDSALFDQMKGFHFFFNFPFFNFLSSTFFLQLSFFNFLSSTFFLQLSFFNFPFFNFFQYIPSGRNCGTASFWTRKRTNHGPLSSSWHTSKNRMTFKKSF